MKGNKRLKQTLLENKDKIKPYSVIDAYNRSINGGGIINTISCGVSFRNELFIIVPNGNRNKTR